MADSELDTPGTDIRIPMQRTHPSTVIIRTAKVLWQALIGLVVVFVFGATGDNELPALAIAGIALLSVAIGLAASWVAWWRFEYGIIGSDLLVVEGLLVRKRRTIPIARVHGVNVKADVLSRVLGLVELVVQTAGGGANEPEAKIGAITLDRAEELRNALLYDTPSGADTATTAGASGGADAAHAAEGASASASTTSEQLIGADPVGRMSDFRGAFGGSERRGREVRFEHKIPLGRLIIGEITSNRVPIAIAIAVGVAGQAIEVVGSQVIEDTASQLASLAIPALIALVLGIGLFAILVATVVAVARDFGFTARRYETRVETEAGLLERRQISLPVTRIQAVRIEESWLRKLLGLSTIHVDTAGLERSGQQGQPAAGSKAMVPVARTAEVPELMHGLLPEAEHFPATSGLPARALRFYIFVPTLLAISIALLAVGPTSWFLYRPALPWGLGGVAIVGLITATVRGLQWRAAGTGTDESAITLQSGVLGRKRVMLTRSRIQSLSVRQNPFQRRRGLASLETVSVSGSSKASYGVSHLDEAEAMRIADWYEEGLARPRSA